MLYCIIIDFISCFVIDFIGNIIIIVLVLQINKSYLSKPKGVVSVRMENNLVLKLGILNIPPFLVSQTILLTLDQSSTFQAQEKPKSFQGLTLSFFLTITLSEQDIDFFLPLTRSSFVAKGPIQPVIPTNKVQMVFRISSIHQTPLWISEFHYCICLNTCFMFTIEEMWLLCP